MLQVIVIFTALILKLNLEAFRACIQRQHEQMLMSHERNVKSVYKLPLVSLSALGIPPSRFISTRAKPSHLSVRLRGTLT